MKFMVAFRLQPHAKNKLIDQFELRGPNHTQGVQFQNAWVGTRSDVVFALVESDSEELVVQACDSWREFGEYDIHPVADTNQI